MTAEKRPFHAGDLVRIDAGTEDASLPDDRVGILLERADTRPKSSSWNILFVNGQVLKFHECFIVLVESDD